MGQRVSWTAERVMLECTHLFKQVEMLFCSRLPHSLLHAAGKGLGSQMASSIVSCIVVHYKDALRSTKVKQLAIDLVLPTVVSRIWFVAFVMGIPR